jgi:hypothetical protein
VVFGDRLKVPVEASDSAARRATLARWVVSLVAVWALCLLPLRVVGLGWRPLDDSRRHVAKVLADKPWSEILVLRDDVTIDSHPGWHALLGAARRAGVTSASGLLVVSVVSLGVLFLCVPLVAGRARPESWMLALLVVALAAPGFYRRLFSGRPFVFPMALLLLIALVWPGLRAARFPSRLWLGLALGFALAVWIHGNWYLWAFPIGCFLLAQERIAALRLSTTALAGTLAGALATGHPLAFLEQYLKWPFWVLMSRLPSRVLVTELQPSDGVPEMVAVVLGFVLWRHLRGRDLRQIARDPVFVVAVVGWVLALNTRRFWWDWGLPATLVWMTRELDDALPAPAQERRRVLASTLIAGVLVLAVTGDHSQRWSRSEKSVFLSAEREDHRRWLPEPGGVLYSNDMRIFFNTFFRNPRAPWRYVLGFESALMPRDELAIYRKIQLEGASDASFRPWVEKMRPEDRLVIVRASARAPKIAELEWGHPFRDVWVGLRPRAGEGPREPPPSGPSGQPADSDALFPEGGGGESGSENEPRSAVDYD